MKKASNILWGLILIAIGVIFALKATNVIDINFFFDGWWTLFIIVPSFVSLFTQREKLSGIIGIGIGVFLLLCCQGILDFTLMWKLLLPAVIVVIGLKMVLGGIFGNKTGEVFTQMKADGKQPQVGCATFSGCNMNFDGEIFDGAELTAVFGGVDCDLRHAIIEKDCAIQVSAIFGGIKILVPDHVNVKVNSNSIFGGITNKTAAKKDAVTLYVSGTCLFGGVEIK